LNRPEDVRPVPPRVFAEPWQAQAFAMVLSLHERGLFTWPEWAAALSRVIRAQGSADDGHAYYEHWVQALQTLLQEKAATQASDVDALAAAWQRAAVATPHGQAIELANDPLRQR
jgi:nitrile hydratase accessory protein